MGWKRRVLLFLFVILVGLQFKQPDRSRVADAPSQAIAMHLDVPTDVAEILERSCSDCHTNNTHWPWYGYVAPVSWWLEKHVNEARSHLNFAAWGELTDYKAAHKLEEIREEVEKGAMPLPSYLRIHRDAKLSPSEVDILTRWASTQEQIVRARLN